MEINSTQRDRSRIYNFPLKISKREEEFLKKEAKKRGRSIASLIREGYINKLDSTCF